MENLQIVQKIRNEKGDADIKKEKCKNANTTNITLATQQQQQQQITKTATKIHCKLMTNNIPKDIDLVKIKRSTTTTATIKMSNSPNPVTTITKATAAALARVEQECIRTGLRKSQSTPVFKYFDDIDLRSSANSNTIPSSIVKRGSELFKCGQLCGSIDSVAITNRIADKIEQSSNLATEQQQQQQCDIDPKLRYGCAHYKRRAMFVVSI